MLPDKIFGLFYMYGLMIALGLLVCFGLLFAYGRKKKIQSSFMDFVFYIGIFAVAGGFGSAALFQATYNYIESPEKGFHFNGGITFIGGLIGGVVIFLALYFIFRKKYEARLVDIISFLPCCILIAHAFGRVGCFFAGCCYGKETDGFLGIKFPGMSHKVHPTQLYEAIFLFALFTACALLLYKKKFKYNLSLYLVAYGIFRFCIEFLRGDDRGKLVGFLSPSQFWSICMVVAGVGVYFLLEWAYKRRTAELERIAQAKAQEVPEPSSVEEEKEVEV